MKKSIEFRLLASAAYKVFLLKLLDKGTHLYNLALSDARTQPGFAEESAQQDLRGA